MELSRIEDFIINGEGQEFNFYGQRRFVAPPYKEKAEFYDYLMFVAIKKYNYDIYSNHKKDGILKFIPNDFLQNCTSFEEAKVEFERLKNNLSQYEVYDPIVKCYETLKDRFERGEKMIASSVLGGGEKIYSHKLSGEELDISDRLYIPCNSEYCYRFARLIVEKSIKYGLNFEFKIMNVEWNLNGADNIVMYIKGKEFSKQVNMINEIVSENPDITFGQIHMFGYPVNNYIALAPEIGGNSYSGYMENLLEEKISKYGRTSYCAKVVQNDVIDILNAFDIIEDMDRILHSQKSKFK